MGSVRCAEEKCRLDVNAKASECMHFLLYRKVKGHVQRRYFTGAIALGGDLRLELTIAFGTSMAGDSDTWVDSNPNAYN